MAVIYYNEIETECCGTILIAATEHGLCQLGFGRFIELEPKLKTWSLRWLNTDTWQPEPQHPILKQAEEQLIAYFNGNRREFDLSYDLYGTPFQIQVWQALLQIDYGVTWSYKQIAESINQPKAVRAVGGANNKNPVSIMIPCHRVIGANGQLVGYGSGLDMKENLLKLEKVEY